ncbi:MAG: hemolysin family protein [Spirochaetales bacterium]
MSIALMITALILLVACSAFFSSSETAFLSISKLRLRQMQKEKNPKIKLIVSLKENMSVLFTTILIGNNFVNSLASSLATALAITLFGNSGVGIATMVMTVIIIIFGEIFPKTIAAYNNESVALLFGGTLNFLKKVLFPFVWIFSQFTHFVYWLSNKMSAQDTTQITEDELKTLFDLGNQEGTLELKEKDMLHKIFEFSDLRAYDIERARPLVKMIDCDTDYANAVKILSESGYSRLPVYENDAENIIGIIHFKDILFYAGDKKDFSLKKSVKKILFIPETKTALGILQVFKIEKQNFAVIIDEHGSFSGIVTMDDLVKAVFGHIVDGYTAKILPAEQRIRPVSPSEFIIPGDIEIDDINNLFGLQLHSEDSDTIAGWLLEQFGHLPDETEMLRRGNILYTVEVQNQRRIQSIRMKNVKIKANNRIKTDSM